MTTIFKRTAHLPATKSFLDPTDAKLKRPLCTTELFREVVRVIVGPDRVEFDVHKGLLCDCSPFFERAFNGNFIEAENTCVELGEQEPEVFAIFQNWLYTRRIVTDQEGQDSECTIMQLVKLYALADQYRITALVNATMDIFIEQLYEQKIFPNYAVEEVYQNTRSDDHLRRLLVDIACCMAPIHQLEFYSRSVLPQDFLIELNIATTTRFRHELLKHVPKIEPSLRTIRQQKCKYHDHSGKEKCSAK